MEELLKKLSAWFTRLFGTGSQSPGERGSKHSDRDQRRASRFDALSSATRWAAFAEAEYEVPGDLRDRRGLVDSSESPVLESPVPNGGAPFNASTAASLHANEVEDTVAGASHSSSDGGDDREAGDDDDDKHDGGRWYEVWEADGLLSHDGTYLRFQSWDGRYDVEVLVGDMDGELDGDNLRLIGENYRFVLDDLEPLRPPFGRRDDLAETFARRHPDGFGGLLTDFPQLSGPAE